MPKVNVITRLEFELTHDDVTIHHVNRYATEHILTLAYTYFSAMKLDDIN